MISKHTWSKKFRDPVIFYLGNKKFRVDLSRSSYINYELRDLKVKYMDIYFKNYKLDGSWKDHLYNYIFMHNEYFQKKVCLLKFLKDRNIKKIKKIKFLFLTKKDIFIFKEFGIEIGSIKQKRTKHIFILLFRLFLINLIINIRTRNFYKENQNKMNISGKHTKIVSAWAIDEVESFLKEIQKSLDKTIIYLKPPNIKFILKYKRKRLLDFIRLMRSGKYDYFEYYPKINFFKVFNVMFRIYFSSIPKEIKRSLLGVYTQRLFYDKLAKYINKNYPDVKEYYCNRTSHSYTTYLTERLRDLGIKSINISWILDIGCPILKYDEFYICSKVQQDCYIAPNTEFKYKKKREIKINGGSIKEKELAIFFIHQCIFSEEVLQDSLIIKPLYKEVIEYIERISHDFKVYAKYHPSSSEDDKTLSKNITIINDVKELPQKYKYISLTYFSTFAITLLDKMPFLLINPKGAVDLRYVYPDFREMYIESYDELKDKAKKLTNDDNYLKYWNELVFLMQDLGF